MRTREAERRRRAEGAFAHLLLVVVLALGVFLMHTVGHPEGSGGGMDTTSATAPGTAAAAAAAAAGHETGHRAHGGASSDTGHEPSGTGMDMTTLCVAVLAGWLLTGLVRAALGRRPDWLALLLARLAPAPGPHAPPPRPPDLAGLSVLRI
ncbi:DUF6153 family protein [Streptomyces zaomyceticus]|uniref:DUF6153 family protein n=1 Tax=Streptomyces zaomyceticus TaxID=68286 RepID=UPI002E108253|nr:DUF6153 family protein [Streptomyces zaomyceticus]